MLTGLEIENFKAIRGKVTVPLGPLTVLIGPNDSGKSTILQALQLLHDSVLGDFHKGPPFFERELDEYLPDHDRGRKLTVAADGQLAGGDFRYELGLGYDRQTPWIAHEQLVWRGASLFEVGAGTTRSVVIQDGRRTIDTRSDWQGMQTNLSQYRRLDRERYAPLPDILDELPAQLVRLDPKRIAEPVAIDQPFAPDGYGLVNVVDDLLSGPERGRVKVVEDILGALAPHVRTVTTRKAGGQRKELCFLLRDGKTVVPAALMSDGVLLAAGFALLVHGLPQRRLLIEEPENGIHPRRVGAVMQTLRDAAQARGTQLVVTTHSPLLLNHVAPDEVIITTRGADGEVVATPFGHVKNVQSLLDDLDLGELWYALGEQNLVAETA